MKIFDLHNDTVHKIKQTGLRRNPTAQLDLTRMLDAGYALSVFAAFVDMKDTGDSKSAWDECVALLSALRAEIAVNGDIIAPVYCADDLSRNLSAGKMSALLSVEEGGVIGDDIGRVATLYALGVRMCTFTWNYINSVAHPAYDAESGRGLYTDSEYISDVGGLTPFGYDFISALEEYGIIADVSHLSDRGIADVARVAKRPFIASHSNARTVCPVVRNLPDRAIRSIADSGGIIGLNLCCDFITREIPRGDTMLCSLSRHARHIIDVGGEQCLAIGSDFDGIPPNPDIPDCAAMPRLTDALISAGFTSRQTELIMGDNAHRFLSDTL